MRNIAKGLVACLIIFAISSCDTGDCNPNLVYGLSVTVEDTTGKPITDATVTITEGDYSEELTGSSLGIYDGAGERPGDYWMTVSAAGYTPYEQAVVVEEGDDCHVVTSRITVTMEEVN